MSQNCCYTYQNANLAVNIDGEDLKNLSTQLSPGVYARANINVMLSYVS